LKDIFRFRILGLAFVSLLLYGLTDNMRGPLYPDLLREFSLSNLRGSLFFSVCSVFSFMGGLSTPFWLKRIEALWSLRLATFLCFLSMLALSQAKSFEAMIYFIIPVFGFSLGLMGVLENYLVVRASPPHLKSKLLSGLHSMYGLSSLVAASSVVGIAGLLKAFSFPIVLWRACFIFSALACLLFLIATFVLHVPKSFIHQLNPANDGQMPITGTLKNNSLKAWIFGLVVSSYTLMEVLISSRLSLFYQRLEGASVEAAAAWVMAFFVFLLASRMLFSVWTPTISVTKLIPACLLISTVFLVLGILFYSPLISVAGFFMGPTYPLLIVKVGRDFQRNLSVVLSRGIAMSSLFLVAMNFMVGAATDIWGLKTAFLIAPAFGVLAMVLLSIESLKKVST
jgi:MFS transporter, FHS family, glucose/mannose:H+ symporter